ncbi:MAG: ester cyclase [Candidatus Promineifilaceae bacterium]
MSEQNKMLVRRDVQEVWNRGNYVLVDQLVASDYVGHQPRNEANGREGYKQFFVMLRAGFPDIHFTVDDQIAEGDKVVTRWTARATHKGQFQGIPPTGKRGEVTGTTIYRVANGKIVEGWTNVDDLGMLQQIGAIPTPGPIGE